MSYRRPDLSGYQGVWLFAMFDLPVGGKAARRAYARFRSLLRKLGFSMLQLSVYARYFASEEASLTCRGRIAEGLPSRGQVRLVMVTDRQFEKMSNYVGKLTREPEQPPKQLMLF